MPIKILELLSEQPSDFRFPPITPPKFWCFLLPHPTVLKIFKLLSNGYKEKKQCESSVF